MSYLDPDIDKLMNTIIDEAPHPKDRVVMACKAMAIAWQEDRVKMLKKFDERFKESSEYLSGLLDDFSKQLQCEA